MSAKRVKSAVAVKIRRRNTFLAVFAVVMVILTALFTPIFDITDIYVTGARVLTPKEVINASGIKKGSNLFLLNTDKAEKKISTLGYVESAEVKRKFFARIEIEIVESTEAAYVAFSGNYIGLGADGKVISINKSSKMKPKKAVISGYGIKQVKKGQMVVGKSEEKTAILKELLGVLEDNDFLTSLKKIDISDLSAITCTMTTDTKIIIGNREQLDYKLKCLSAVLDELKEIRGGKIDVSDPSNVIYEGGN